MDNSAAAKHLRESGLKATEPRVAVYRYLYEHRTHPTAQDIYSALCVEHPGLSFATVYNTLWSLCRHSLAVAITIDKNELRFDACTAEHGHFLCTKCHKVFDFPVAPETISGLDGFAVEHRDIYCSGLCPECRAK